MPKNNEAIPTPNNEGWFSENLKKAIPGILFAVLAGFLSSYWTTRDAQNDLRYQVLMNKEAIAQNAETSKKTAEALNLLTIAVTKISEAQNRTAEDVKGLQDRERQNSAYINRK